jgi:hypothetical protein
MRVGQQGMQPKSTGGFLLLPVDSNRELVTPE